MTKKLFIAIVFTLLVAGDAAAQKLRINVQGIAQPTPVAIVPLGWEGNAPRAPLDIAAVITSDLQRSGRFAPIAETDMLQKPTDGANVDFDDWTILGVEAVVVGKLIETGDNAYTLQFQLFDPISRKQLIGYRMPASRGTMRAAAHRAADMIYEKLTGIKRRVRHQGRLRYGRATWQRAPVLPDRFRSGRRERPQDHGEQGSDHVAGVVAGQPSAGLRIL